MEFETRVWRAADEWNYRADRPRKVWGWAAREVGSATRFADGTASTKNQAEADALEACKEFQNMHSTKWKKVDLDA